MARADIVQRHFPRSPSTTAQPSAFADLIPSVGCRVAVIRLTPSGASKRCLVPCGTIAIIPALRPKIYVQGRGVVAVRVALPRTVACKLGAEKVSVAGVHAFDQRNVVRMPDAMLGASERARRLRPGLRGHRGRKTDSKEGGDCARKSYSSGTNGYPVRWSLPPAIGFSARLSRPCLAIHPFIRRRASEMRTFFGIGGIEHEVPWNRHVDDQQSANTPGTVWNTLPRRPKVFFGEWDDPLISGIGRIAGLVEIAGGNHDAALRILGPQLSAIGTAMSAHDALGLALRSARFPAPTGGAPFIAARPMGAWTATRTDHLASAGGRFPLREPCRERASIGLGDRLRHRNGRRGRASGGAARGEIGGLRVGRGHRGEDSTNRARCCPECCPIPSLKQSRGPSFPRTP